MKVRLWKLGSLEHKIYPGPEAFVKLSEVLKNITKDSITGDIIWGPALSVEVIDIGDELPNVVVPDKQLTPEDEQKIINFVKDIQGGSNPPDAKAS